MMQRLFYRFCSAFIPVKRKKVLFLSDIRSSLGGNYAPLYDRLIQKGFEVVCDFSADKRAYKGKKRLLKRAYDLATSGYIVLEDFHSDTEWVTVRKNQELVQLWHAAGAFKKFAWSRNEDNPSFKISGGYTKITKAIVSAEDIRKDYASAYRIDIDKVLATGIPRTDIFFDREYMDSVRNIYDERYPELKGKKILLFAPTYRGNSLKKAYYDLDRIDPGKLQQALGEDYAIVFKWHPAMAQRLKREHTEAYDYAGYGGTVLDLSSERDINDLMMIADIVITDYSSVVFEYELMHKPIIYYWYDIEAYRDDRGFYYDLDEYVYGSIAYDFDQLLEAVKHPDMCDDKRAEFHRKFMSACDGHSAERVMEQIFESRNNGVE